MTTVIYIPLAREYRLLPLQVALCRKYVAELTRIVVVETLPGASWGDSGGPWQLKRSKAEELGVTVQSSPEYVCGHQPKERIRRTFQFMMREARKQPEDCVLILSGDVLPIRAINAEDLLAEMDLAFRSPFAANTWTAIRREHWCENMLVSHNPHKDGPPLGFAWTAQKTEMGMELCDPGFLHVDKLASTGDFYERKFAALSTRFCCTFPTHEEMRDDIADPPKWEMDISPLFWWNGERAGQTTEPASVSGVLTYKAVMLNLYQAEWLARLPAELRAKVDEAKKGCGCHLRENITPLLPAITEALK